MNKYMKIAKELSEDNLKTNGTPLQFINFVFP